MLIHLRKWVFTAITLIIACVIAWWASYTEARVNNHVRHEVTKLVPRAHANPAIIDDLLRLRQHALRDHHQTLHRLHL